MNQLRAFLNADNEQEHTIERIEALLDLLNAIEEIIPATPGSRSHIEHQLHRLMADMIASRKGQPRISAESPLSALYH